jgi:hypothetical protein
MTPWEYRVVISLTVPVALSVVGILAKKISRGPRGGWRRSDIYLGREFVLAGVATAISSIVVILLKPGRVFNVKEDVSIIGGNFAAAFVGFLMFMFIINLSLEYEDETHSGTDRTRELKMIGCVSNAIGIGILVWAVFLMAD